ncbi:MAG TPA: amidohydrolase [Verrucomicrobiae bacterium]|nr:amidohydrolase [Verrucomicrobiae bacterium]
MKLCTIFNSLALGSVLFFATHGTLTAAENPPPADVIICNAKVLTVNSNFTTAQAIAVRGNQIVAIGKDKQILRFKGPETRVIDGHEHTVMPGLYDNLVDSYQASVSTLNGPLPMFDSIARAKDFIHDQAAQKPAGAWIVVERAFPTRLKECRLPTKAELDAVAPKNPVYWNCGDLAVVNTKALEVLHLTTTTTNPSGGEIVLDPVTRKPTGLLRHASSVVKLPPAAVTATAQQHRDALKHLYGLYNEQGITSIGESDAEPEVINLFRDMAASNELTVRINCTRYVAPGATIEETTARLDALTNTPADKPQYGPTGAGDDWVRIGPLLAQVDGDLLDSTAYLRTPWGIGPAFQITEPAYRGKLVTDPDVLTSFFTAAAQRGWQITADCTGDAGLDQLLNCYQKVQFKTDISQRRFLLRHANFQAEQDWNRCVKLGVGAEMQPICLYHDGSGMLKLLGEKRLRNFEAFKGWFDHGLLIGAGSGHQSGLNSLDSANFWNPWYGLWVTLARQTAQNDGIYVKEEQLSREQAIQFYTMNNAKLHFEEEKKGSLEIGKLADLIVLDRDIMKCAVDDVRDTQVQLTLLDGKIVWEAKQPPAPVSQAPEKKLASLPPKRSE